MAQNIVPSWKERNVLLEKLRQDLENIIEKNPSLKPAMVDAEEFLEDFYFSSSAKTLDMTVSKDNLIGFHIDTVKNNKSIKGDIFFEGMGQWHYDFQIRDNLYDVSHYSYDGMGYEMNIRKKEDESDFLFSISDELEQFLQVDEPFSQDYSPMYSIQTRPPRGYNKGVSWGWTEGYYDGPLSGYCYYDKKLLRFELQEEKDYSQQRLYVMYSLDFFEKFKVKIKHWFWEHPMMFLPQKTRSYFFYNIVRPIFSFKDKQFKGRKPVGYFTY